MSTKRDTPEAKAKFAAYMREWVRTHPEYRERNKVLRRANYRKNLERETPDERRERLERRRKKQRKNYKKNVRFYGDKQREAQKAQTQRIRAAILAGYGGKCVCCGETEPLFLQLDHINGGGRKELREHGHAHTFYRRVIAEGFPDRYRILCANCNSGRERNGGTCPHNRGV